MDVDTALRVLSRITGPEDEEAAHEMYGAQVMALILAFRERVENDEEYQLEEREPAAVFALIENLRQIADSTERDLLRQLKWGAEGMTWEEVAKAVDGQLGGRQAMQKRWARLTSPTRRTTTGDMRRGAARRRTVSDVDTTTTPEEG